jgi:predicted TIM-barrel fold metal-dependent hydrolase
MTQLDQAPAEELPEFLRDPEPREVHYTVISVDDHLVEPPDMFEGREPARFAGRFPRIVELEPGKTYSRAQSGLPPLSVHTPGRQAWEFDGNLFLQVGLNAVAGYSSFETLSDEPTSFAEMRPGCYDVDARVHDMDLGGIWASLNFPSSITGFAGAVFSRTTEPELGQAVMRAWNDWMYEQWHGRHPERVIPMGITWLADPEVAAAEVRRNAARGFTALSFPEMPHRLGYPPVHSEHWAPLFRACEETGTALCLHVGSSGMLDLPPDGPRFEKNTTLFPALSLLSAVEWLWSGVPVRYPELSIVLSEGGIGWVPMLLDRLDFMLAHAGSLADFAQWTHGTPPSEVLREHFYFCTLDDPSTLAVAVEKLGADRIMVEMDYPHTDSTWPDTQPLLRRRFAENPSLGAEEIRAITHGNAARVFRHPLPANPLP